MQFSVSTQITPDSFFNPLIPTFTPNTPLCEDEEVFISGIMTAWRYGYCRNSGLYRPNVLWLPEDLCCWARSTPLHRAMVHCTISDYLLRLHPSLYRIVCHPLLTGISVLLDDRSLEGVAKTESTGWLLEGSGETVAHPGAAIIIKP